MKVERLLLFECIFYSVLNTIADISDHLLVFFKQNLKLVSTTHITHLITTYNLISGGSNIFWPHKSSYMHV